MNLVGTWGAEIRGDPGLFISDIGAQAIVLRISKVTYIALSPHHLGPYSLSGCIRLSYLAGYVLFRVLTAAFRRFFHQIEARHD